MATLTMGEEESRELAALLDGRLREMLHEIAHTDDRSFRSDLRESYERLHRVRNRLS